MFWIFNKKAEKKEIEQLKAAVQTGFNNAKQDITNISGWIKHLDQNNNKLKQEVFDLKGEISSVKEELDNLKNIMQIVSERQVFKARQTMFTKQQTGDVVLNAVQTSVQTDILDRLSSTERAIVFVLLNSDLKLSHADLASMLGKRKATIRGQINSIKQKSEGLIEEIIGDNNKKRVYIPDKIKEILLKRRKVRDKIKEKKQENEEFEENNEKY